MTGPAVAEAAAAGAGGADKDKEEHPLVFIFFDPQHFLNFFPDPHAHRALGFCFVFSFFSIWPPDGVPSPLPALIGEGGKDE